MEKSVVYGRGPVYEYLKAGLFTNKSILTILDSAHGEALSHIVKLAQKKAVKISKADKRFFQKFEERGDTCQGIVLSFVQPYQELSDAKIKECADTKTPLLILDQITDPHNLGAIARSAEALGFGGIIIPKDNSSSVTSVVMKTSAGATAHIPMQYVTNLARTIDELKALGFWIIGSSDHGENSPAKISEYSPSAIVIGSEGKGMRKLTEKKCDIVVKISLNGKTNSLNASVAAGILMYEAAKTLR